MIEKINSAIRCMHLNIVNDEEHGLRFQAVEKLDDLMLLIRLREAYKAAKERGLIY